MRLPRYLVRAFRSFKNRMPRDQHRAPFARTHAREHVSSSGVSSRQRSCRDQGGVLWPASRRTRANVSRYTPHRICWACSPAVRTRTVLAETRPRDVRSLVAGNSWRRGVWRLCGSQTVWCPAGTCYDTDARQLTRTRAAESGHRIGFLVVRRIDLLGLKEDQIPTGSCCSALPV